MTPSPARQARSGKTLALVGCGRMGSALLQGWLPKVAVHVLDPAAPAIDGTFQLPNADALARLPRPMTVVLAVKPQVLAAVLPSLRACAGDDVLFLSVVAGAPIAALRAGLGDGARIIRTMPNTPAAVLAGISALVSGPCVSAEQRAEAEALMKAVGQTVWLDSEDQLHAVTAISGSGPAYFFRFAETLAAAGRALGLSPQVAEQLARCTLTGAGALASTRSVGLDQLRTEVTSPGGTTAAGLGVFEAGDSLTTLVAAAAEAAAHRSVTLGDDVSAALAEETGRDPTV